MAIPMVEELGLKKTEMKAVQWAFEQRRAAKSLEDQAKEMKEAANGTIAPIMEKHEIKSFSIPGVGAVTRVEQERATLNKDKLKTELLSMGFTVDQVTELIERSSTKSSSVSIQFKQSR